MADQADLEERLRKLEGSLEKKDPGSWLQSTALQLLSPLLVVGVGYFLNGKIDEARLAINQVEVVSKMTGDLFTETPARALITVRLLKKVVDEELAKEISDVVANHYLEKLESESSKPGAAKKTADLLAALRSADSEVKVRFDARAAQSDTELHAVVASISKVNKSNAINFARGLVSKGYAAEVHLSTTGFYAITLGHGNAAAATELIESAKKKGDATPDAYLHDGSRFIERVFP